MEAAIAARLTQRLTEFAPDIGRASAALAELDCLLSLAIAARELNLCRPQVRRSRVRRVAAGLVDRRVWPQCTAAAATVSTASTGRHAADHEPLTASSLRCHPCACS